ncbi:MAG: KamA family radical SAM protein, partial [Desulfobacterales bacterium]|nr:KamA family radical SAM protein [Desulfobacterales bacterium]
MSKGAFFFKHSAVTNKSRKPPSITTLKPGDRDAGLGEPDEPPSPSFLLNTGTAVPALSPLFLKSANIIRNPRSRILRRQIAPQAKPVEWNDWQWQLRNRIRSVETLSKIINLSAEERKALEAQDGGMPLAITPYYASLLDKMNPAHPLRRAVVPVGAELLQGAGEAEDPLGEESDSPVPGLVHRYPDRVLFLVTDSCSPYCRYCTRSRRVGRGAGHEPGRARWENALAYIESRPEIRDVLISGGDPLTLGDEALEWLLTRLRRIPHVEIIRIGTKVPAVLPQRITGKLVRILKRFHPLWINIHFMHPDELTPETRTACTRLADAGIPLGSQTVLLKGINDDGETMKRLFQGLLKLRVRPYYLYQCDPIAGSAHFRTPVAKGLEIIRALRGHTTGLAVPHYVIDAPGGGGKIPLLPEYAIGR